MATTTQPRYTIKSGPCAGKVVTRPTDRTLEKWALWDGNAKAIDGCTVEPDGHCPHGYQSWLLVLGIL